MVTVGDTITLPITGFIQEKRAAEYRSECSRAGPAKERDDEEVARWLAQEFPRILAEAKRRDAHLVFLDESGFMLTPVVRRTSGKPYACSLATPLLSSAPPSRITVTALRLFPFYTLQAERLRSRVRVADRCA